jgi:hypothetical protein
MAASCSLRWARMVLCQILVLIPYHCILLSLHDESPMRLAKWSPIYPRNGGLQAAAFTSKVTPTAKQKLCCCCGCAVEELSSSCGGLRHAANRFCFGIRQLLLGRPGPVDTTVSGACSKQVAAVRSCSSPDSLSRGMKEIAKPLGLE